MEGGKKKMVRLSVSWPNETVSICLTLTEHSSLGYSTEGQKEALALCEVGLESVSSSHTLLEDQHSKSITIFGSPSPHWLAWANFVMNKKIKKKLLCFLNWLSS